VFYLVQQAKIKGAKIIDQTAKINGSQNYGFYSI